MDTLVAYLPSVHFSKHKEIVAKSSLVKGLNATWLKLFRSVEGRHPVFQLFLYLVVNRPKCVDFRRISYEFMSFNPDL